MTLGNDKSTPAFEEEINNSENGILITWEDLNKLAHQFDQVMDIIIIGSQDKCILHRYQDDRDMYESCDIVIQMVDSFYWEVFSKNENLIGRLAKKFNKTESITY